MTAPPSPATAQVTRSPFSSHPTLRGRLLAAWPILVPALVALVSTAWRYDAKPLWRDEVYTLVTAGRPLADMAALLEKSDAGLSFYYLLMHAWLGPSTADWWVRLPSALATVAAVLLTAAVARRVGGDAVALLAGVLLALSPTVVLHAQEARPYPLVLAALAGTALLALRSAELPRRGQWLGLAVLGAVTVGLHPLVALPAVAGIFATLWLRPGRARRLHVVAAAAPAAVLGLALVAAGFVQAAESPPAVSSPWKLLTFWKLFGSTPWPGVVVAVLAVVGVASLATRRSYRRREALVLGAWALLPLGAVSYLGLSGSYFNARYASAAAPALAVLAAVGVVALASLAARRGVGAERRARAVAVAAALVVAGVVMVPGVVHVRERAYDFDDAPTAAAQLAAQSAPGDAVVYAGGVSRPLVQRYAWPVVADQGRLDDALLVAGPLESDTRSGRQLPAGEREQALAAHDRVWLVGTMAVATDDLNRRSASSRAAMQGRYLVSRTDHGHVRVELWQRQEG